MCLLCLYSDVRCNPCHRVPTHGLISVIEISFFITGGVPVLLAIIFIFQINTGNPYTDRLGKGLTLIALLCDGYIYGFGCPILGPYTSNVNNEKQTTSHEIPTNLLLSTGRWRVTSVGRLFQITDTTPY